MKTARTHRTVRKNGRKIYFRKKGGVSSSNGHRSPSRAESVEKAVDWVMDKYDWMLKRLA